MRLSLLLVLAAAAVAAGSTLAGAATGEPSLRVLRAKPLVVVGSGFGPGEFVRVVALGRGGKQVKTVVAGPRGGFKVQLPERKTIGCAPTLVTATGSKGSEAKLTARAGCVTIPPPRD